MHSPHSPRQLYSSAGPEGGPHALEAGGGGDATLLAQPPPQFAQPAYLMPAPAALHAESRDASGSDTCVVMPDT